MLEKSLELEVTTHHGHILKWSGEGVPCIFNSAIEAVQAAIGIQREMLQETKVLLNLRANNVIKLRN